MKSDTTSVKKNGIKNIYKPEIAQLLATAQGPRPKQLLSFYTAME